jgi:hypothetical protein
MRFFLFLLCFLTSNAFAYCGPNWRDDAQLVQSLRAHDRITTKDKRMIHAAVTQQVSLVSISEDEAVEMFFREYADGEILFYSSMGSRFAVLRYWPGGNLYGAIVEVSSRNFMLTGFIQDGEIYCLF